MTNYPCQTVCPNCGNTQKFFLSQIHEGKKCDGCEIKLKTPDHDLTYQNIITDKEWFADGIRQIVSYRKLYSTKKEGYGTVIEFLHSCIHGFWSEDGKCEHEKLNSFMVAL
jgi:hypothetical protein